MKKDLTELVFILDMCGSMAHLTDDTVGVQQRSEGAQ